MPDDLARRWIAVWTHARSLDVSSVDGHPFVQVCSVTRETELLCLDPGPVTFTGLMRHIAGDPRAMLTVIATDMKPYLALTLPRTVRVDRDDEHLMSTRLRTIRTPPLPPGLTVRCEDIDHSVTVTLEDHDRVAAQGSVGVLGADATYDAVETTPAYRRRGLARQVMSMLTDRAIDRGATTGVLAASASGRTLYENLGWTTGRPMLSLMGTAQE